MSEMQQIILDCLKIEIYDQFLSTPSQIRQNNDKYLKQAKHSYQDQRPKRNSQKQVPCEKLSKKQQEEIMRKNEQKQAIQQQQKSFQQRTNLLVKINESFHQNYECFKRLWESSDQSLIKSIQKICQEFFEPNKIFLSQKEINIAQSLQNILVIGRSGTGKTTTAMIKLTSMQMSFQHELNINSNLLSSQTLRIGFTTVSNYLKFDINNFYRKVMCDYSKETDHHTLTQVNQWPLFTNIRQLIHLIDGNLAIPFIQRDSDGAIIKDNLELRLDDLLRVKVMEGSIYYQEVGIKNFIDGFWNQNKTNFEKMEVDPYQTYSQIHSYITGHHSSFKFENNMIPQDQYMNLVGTTKTHLKQESKQNIYKICQQYQQWKKQYLFFDLNDQINYILKNIFDGKYDSYNGYFHYLFVDEVQDLNCACLYMLSLLTEQSVFLGGDTAQTINLENSFRFNDLLSLYKTKNKNIDNYAINQVLGEDIQQEQLTQNFRSHCQIIELNNSVVKLLEIFFPTSIDHLIPEISIKKGPKPIIVNSRECLYKFLQQDAEKEVNVDYFGRLQIFIVKDYEQKEKLKQILTKENKKFQVFTVLESKGLEFQDVITYNLLGSSYNYTHCWKALNLLKIEDENIPIKEFQKNFNCELKSEFSGSTFERLKDSDFVRMKTIQKEENAEAKIQKDYSKEFNKLIGELKNIYVAFSRARSRIFIYEDSIYVGKQLKNPIISFFEDLNLFDKTQITDEGIKSILNDHLQYIKDNEPIRNNKEQFISMAQLLSDKYQYLEAAYYYELIGDFVNKRVCEAKIKINEAKKIIDQNKEQFEKEKKQYLEYYANPVHLKLFSKVKDIYLQAINELKDTPEQELIAKIQYRMGEYSEAINTYNRYLQILKSQNDNKQQDKKIQEINNNIKNLYLLKADILERGLESSDKQIVSAMYQDFESFLENENVIDGKILLYISFRLDNPQKLFKNLILFKNKNLIEKDDLIRTLHYYYPIILEQELQKINELPKKTKYNMSEIKTTLGIKLVDLLKNLILPFQEEFYVIARSRQNMEYFQSQIKFFENISKIQEFKNIDIQNIINGKNLMMFYIMLIHFNCTQSQKKFNEIVSSSSLAHSIYIDLLFNNSDDQNKIQDIFQEISSLDWIKSGKARQQYISQNDQYYYVFLGFYYNLLEKKLIEGDRHFRFTIDIAKNYQKYNINNAYDMQLIFQNIVNNKIKLQNANFYINNSIYINTLSFNYRVLQRPRLFITSLDTIYLWIEKRQIHGQDIDSQFTICQDLLKVFYNFLQNQQNIQILTTEYIEKLITVIEFIINFNYDKECHQLVGKYNEIFIDAFCSTFGFITPYSLTHNTIDENRKSYWKMIGYFDYYLINQDSQIMQNQMLSKQNHISPIKSSNLKIVNKKTAILLCKKELGEVSKHFLIFYAENLKHHLKKQVFSSQLPEVQINLPFQILYLNQRLKQLVESIEIQDIPKKHADEHEIDTLTKFIEDLEDQLDNENNLEEEETNLIQMKLDFLQRKLKKKQKEKKFEKKVVVEIEQIPNIIDEKQYFSFRNNIISHGLVINSYFQIRNQYQTISPMDLFLLKEAANILANLIDKIEQSQELNEDFDNPSNIDLSLKKTESELKKQEKFFKYYQDLINESIQQNIEDNEVEQDEQISNTQSLQTEGLNTLIVDSNLKQEEDIVKVEEDQKIEKQRILNFCDDILYVLTILNMRSMKQIIYQILPKSNNELVQFTYLCLEFFKARSTYNRPLIGLKSLEILSKFKDNINHKSQVINYSIFKANSFFINLNKYYYQTQILTQKLNENFNKIKLQILSIGLTEILQHLLPNIPKTKVIAIKGFSQCYSFFLNSKNEQCIKVKVPEKDPTMDEIINGQLQKYFNWLFDILPELNIHNNSKIRMNNMITYCLLIYLKQHKYPLRDPEFRQKILQYFKSCLKTDLIEKRNEGFKDANDVDNYFKNVSEIEKYYLFRDRFYKTFLQNLKGDENTTKLIDFIKSIRYIYFEHILFLNKDKNDFIICKVEVEQAKINYEIKNNTIIEEEQQIIDLIKIAQNQYKQQKKENNFVTLFYKSDFISFMNQQIFQEYTEIIQFKLRIYEQYDEFQQQFLDTVILIQKVRKIFLQELVTTLNSSEKYIYIIQKLLEISQKEGEYYRKLASRDSFVYNHNSPSEFTEQLNSCSYQCQEVMSKVYRDYLSYLAEPQIKIEKIKLDPQLFIQELISFKN